MKKSMFISLFVALVLGLALAHQTREVGEEGEQYRVIVGMVREPVFTEERNGLDLIIRRAADDSPVEGLQESVSVDFIAPDGTVRTLRAQHGKPGYYTDDIILTAPGVYGIRVYGFIGGLELDELFETHEVRALSSLRFP